MMYIFLEGIENSISLWIKKHEKLSTGDTIEKRRNQREYKKVMFLKFYNTSKHGFIFKIWLILP